MPDDYFYLIGHEFTLIIMLNLTEQLKKVKKIQKPFGLVSSQDKHKEKILSATKVKITEFNSPTRNRMNE